LWPLTKQFLLQAEAVVARQSELPSRDNQSGTAPQWYSIIGCTTISIVRPVSWPVNPEAANGGGPKGQGLRARIPGALFNHEVFRLIVAEHGF